MPIAGVLRSRFYSTGMFISEEELLLMHKIDECHLMHPSLQRLKAYSLLAGEQGILRSSKTYPQADAADVPGSAIFEA